MLLLKRLSKKSKKESSICRSQMPLSTSRKRTDERLKKKNKRNSSMKG